MADRKSDPVEIWQAMLGEMEKGFSAFTVRAPEAGTAPAARAPQQLGEMMEAYLAGMNLPSRTQLNQFGERLRAIEAHLAEITSLLHQSRSGTGGPPTPKPGRSRRSRATAAAKTEPSR